MRRSGISPADLPPKYQAQVAAQLQPPDLRPGGTLTFLPPPKKRLRQSSRELNKTETAFGEYLRRICGQDVTIHSQAITVRLANGLRYTPDYVVVAGPKVTVYEVKGPYAREDSIVKLKVAASVYPWMDFMLAWRQSRTSDWQFQTVLP